MIAPIRSESSGPQIKLELTKYRKRVWSLSGILLVVSLIGLILSWRNPSIGAPLRPGLDFTGGTQIQLERDCTPICGNLDTSKITDAIKLVPLSDSGENQYLNTSSVRVQLLDESESLVLRLPFLSATQGQIIIEAIDPIAGPFKEGAQSLSTIGPSLGAQLLYSSSVSLLFAFVGIALYISVRYDRRYAFLALLALIHDVIIVCGIFAWLGLFLKVEVDSLFAVALLTIAGYSVNDTVVVFDRIRERSRKDSSLRIRERVDLAVSATLTRTLYTSCTTLLPLIALIFFGGSTLYWFAIALALGVVIGSWSSIALAPSLLTLFETKK